ncbi:hypothetical protein EIP91_008456, partial [Steccherinum ochraceum]
MPPGVPPAIPPDPNADPNAFCQTEASQACDCASVPADSESTCSTCCPLSSQSDATAIVFPTPTEGTSDSSTGAPKATGTPLSPQLPVSSTTLSSSPTPTQSDADTSSSISVTPTVRAASSSKAGPIAGGVIGAVILIALLAGA